MTGTTSSLIAVRPTGPGMLVPVGVAPLPSVARRTESAVLVLNAPGRWRPRSGDAAMLVSTSDTDPPAVGLSYPDALLVRMGDLAFGAAHRAAARDRVIEWYLPMTVHLARRFGGRGEPLADLTQVAAVGLIKAVDRYEAARGVPFASYAIPTIVGEIKRYFRDLAWTVRVPRRMQELRPRLTTAAEELAQVLHRPPTTAELATRLGVSQDDVREAWRTASAYRPLSFDRPVAGTEDRPLIDALGGPDPAIEAVDLRVTLRRGLAQLPERELRILTLRYVSDMTQAQIAADIGVSQMQISRLLTQSMSRLREGLDADTDRVAVAGSVDTVSRADVESLLPRG